MEVKGVRRIIDRWREDQNLNAKLTVYAHNRNGKRKASLGKFWPGKQE
jgi:hypothetical protein